MKVRKGFVVAAVVTVYFAMAYYVQSPALAPFIYTIF